ncbi:uncharacterized protein LOC142166086 [Nicotiana tabacum]|uniref:Uncharacterized protein LOC142166086 n=1 Tax=Nicotiana tabacum TaxID=4097 RepID=A0AC58S6U6_TOBAC
MECIQTINFSIIVNGEPTAPFNAGKGLRQGDPMSAFLFAIVLEYLSRNLNGLKTANQKKSEPYFDGLPLQHRQQILRHLRFTARDLPFKYRGVPLSTKKFSILQWQSLIDKMTARITSWTAKTLSYAVTQEKLNQANISDSPW